MLQTWIHRIKPEKEQRLREWLAELNSRTNEVRDSFSAAGVRAEQAFVLSGVTGALLVYVSEAADHAHAARVFAGSQLSIDVEHRQVMDECIEHTLTEAPVYDVVG
jgi:Family of unknown function (DUF6176)